MDLRKIKKLIELVEESGISELEVRSGDEAVRIARPAASAPAPGGVEDVPRTAAQPVQRLESVRAPMAGTFYSAPEPDAEPFVAAGQSIAAGDVVGIIESMKMMNSIETPLAGRIETVLVANETPVESGQPLFRIAVD